MSALGRTVPHGRGEPPQGLASRLAAGYGIDAPRFCAELGMPMQRLVDGGAAAVGRLAALAGCEPGPLLASAITREGGAHVFAGQRLGKEALRRNRLHCCPACLGEDVARSALPPEQAAFFRAEWLIEPIRTCSVHRLGLVPVDAATARGGRVHDLAARAGPALGRLDAMADAAPGRGPSSLERYVLTRIAAGAGGSGWLDGLDLHVAARTAEMVGAVRLFGRTPNLKGFSDADWHAAGEAGFPIAEGGAATLRPFLEELQRTFPHRGAEGPQAMFGRLYQWLAFSAPGAGHDPVRHLIREHVIDTMPVGPGDDVLGEPVKARRVHSIRSAALETGRHPKTVRRLLRCAGAIPEGLEDVMDSRVTFSAAAAADLLGSAAAQVNLVGLGAYLNAPRVHAAMIAREGFVPQFVQRRGGRSARHAFDPAALDTFLDDLTRDAARVAEPGGAIQDIPGAAKRANRGAAEIVRLLLAGSLGWVGRRAGVDGYLSVLVDAGEVARLTAGAKVVGWTRSELADELGVNWKVARALVAQGALPTEADRHPVKRNAIRVVRPAALEGFRAEHVSLFQLARERGRHFRALNAELVARGVRPSLDPGVYGCTFYRRSEI